MREAPIDIETPPAKDEPATITAPTEQSQQSGKKPERLCLNRAQRRALKQHIAHKARHQIGSVKRRHPLWAEMAEPRCPRCNLRYLGGSRNRCQCQVEQRRQCTCCGAAFMASQQSWQHIDVCAECFGMIGEIRARALDESRYAALDAFYEQHRLVQELR